MANDAGAVTVEIVRDRCSRCGHAREAVFDFRNGKNIATLPFECPNMQACANAMAAAYLTPGPTIPLDHSAKKYGWYTEREVRSEQDAHWRHVQGLD